MKTTRMIIEELADEYLNYENYQWGIISGEWVDKITEELNLKHLTDLELANMWDMVHLTLSNEFYHYDRNGDYKTADKYRDAESAFTEVVNVEARARRVRG